MTIISICKQLLRIIIVLVIVSLIANKSINYYTWYASESLLVLFIVLVLTDAIYEQLVFHGIIKFNHTAFIKKLKKEDSNL